MNKILISAGCSFARGEGLSRKEFRYSNIIAAQYGLNLLDVSTCGASNEHIASCGVYGVHQALKTTKPQNVIVLVGWTEQARFEYWSKKSYTFKSAMTARTIHPEKQHYPDVQLEKFVADNMWSPAFGYYKLLHAFNYLNAFCESRGVRVINVANITLFKIMLPPTKQRTYVTDNSPSFLTESVLTDTQQKVFDSLFTSPSLCDMILRNHEEYAISESDTHPNQKAHEVWAERIVNENKDVLGT